MGAGSSWVGGITALACGTFPCQPIAWSSPELLAANGGQLSKLQCGAKWEQERPELVRLSTTPAQSRTYCRGLQCNPQEFPAGMRTRTKMVSETIKIHIIMKVNKVVVSKFVIVKLLPSDKVGRELSLPPHQTKKQLPLHNA